MVTETSKAVDAQFAALESEYADPNSDVFARTEMFNVNQIASIDTVAAPEDFLRSRQVDTTGEEFRQTFPEGVPTLRIALKGLSVKYNFDASGEKVILIPLQDIRPGKMGERRKRGSQLHVTLEAFDNVFGLRPFGEANRAKLVGRKASWGQHLGSADIDGEKREWAWDVPRDALAADYEYDGIVKVVGGGNTTGAGVGVTQLSEEESNAAVVAVIVGLAVEGGETEAAEKVMGIEGLASEWYTAASSGETLKTAHSRGLIAAKAGKVTKAA
jgi:hypothetical protein